MELIRMRKNAIYILILSLVLFGCHQKPLHPTLQKAEKLMHWRPDSALAILGHYTTRSFSDSADIAAYTLLRTQADDKNYIDHTSDSLIKIAVRYYDRHGSKLQQAQAHYYWGRTFQDRGDDVHTAEQFLVASPLAEREKDITLQCKVKNNLAYLFWSNNMYPEADSIFKQLIHIETRLHDIEGVAICYNMLGNIAMENGKQFIKAEKYEREALKITTSYNYIEIKRSVLSSLSVLFRYAHKPLLSIAYAKKGISISPDSLCDGYFYNIGASFAEIGKTDSASIYLHKSLSIPYCTTKKAAFLELREISRKLGDAKTALYYNDKYENCKSLEENSRNTIKVIRTIESILFKQLQATYKEQSRSSEIIASIILLCFSLFSIGLLVNKKKKEEAINKNERLPENLCEREIEGYIKQIISNGKKEIETLNEKLIVKQDIIQNLQKSLEQQEVKAYSNLFVEFQDLSTYNKNHPGEEKYLNEKNWQEIEACIDKISPNFGEKLQAKYMNLSEEDIQFCYLVRLKLKYSDIEFIINKSRPAVYKRKDSILSRMNRKGEHLIDILIDISQQTIK
ncbi:MAG: hypothetical protein GX416_03610 [Bacteroidales bacterium]|nr:hypothetical protein [Bacteroidales bacterium]